MLTLPKQPSPRSEESQGSNLEDALQKPTAPQFEEGRSPEAMAEPSAARTAASGLLTGRSRGRSKLSSRMPTAEKHLFDSVGMTGCKLYVDSKLEIASRACRPVGGAYHGLTPCQHSL